MHAVSNKTRTIYLSL